MPDKRILLLQQLRRRTLEGTLNWEETADDGAYQATFSNYGVRIRTMWNREHDSPDYQLELYNSNGHLIEEISSDALHEVDPKAGAYQIMAQMFETARRIAMGVEQALDEILQELDDNLPF